MYLALNKFFFLIEEFKIIIVESLLNEVFKTFAAVGDQLDEEANRNNKDFRGHST